VTRNFVGAGITVLLRSATAPYGGRRTDHAAINREIGATHILDLTRRRLAGAETVREISARRSRPGGRR
jgi:hypothetical protein